MAIEERTEEDAYEFGWELGLEGQNLPDLAGAEALGFPLELYDDLKRGWDLANEIAAMIIAEDNGLLPRKEYDVS